MPEPIEIVWAVIAGLCIIFVVVASPRTVRYHRQQIAYRNLTRQFDQVATIMRAAGLTMGYAAELMTEFVQEWEASVVSAYEAAQSVQERIADAYAVSATSSPVTPEGNKE